MDNVAGILLVPSAELLGAFVNAEMSGLLAALPTLRAKARERGRVILIDASGAEVQP